MSDFIKQKQVDGLVAELAAKALDADVVKKANNLSDVTAGTARTNLDVYSKSEVQSMVSGADNARSVADLTARAALTDLKVSDRVFVTDDGDGNWALYIVTAITDGLGSTSTFEKIADQDLFTNAISSSSIKSSYESNADTNAFTDSEKNKVGQISVTQPVDLDTMEADIATNATTAANAQTTANNALTAANSKEDAFTQSQEDFTGLTGTAGLPVAINLTNVVVNGFTPMVFFNGLQVKNVSFTVGSNQISYTVPYATDVTDNISVIYAW